MVRLGGFVETCVRRGFARLAGREGEQGGGIIKPAL